MNKEELKNEIAVIVLEKRRLEAANIAIASLLLRLIDPSLNKEASLVAARKELHEIETILRGEEAEDQTLNHDQVLKRLHLRARQALSYITQALAPTHTPEEIANFVHGATLISSSQGDLIMAARINALNARGKSSGEARQKAPSPKKTSR
jgi:hypothetical protein